MKEDSGESYSDSEEEAKVEKLLAQKRAQDPVNHLIQPTSIVKEAVLSQIMRPNSPA